MTPPLAKDSAVGEPNATEPWLILTDLISFSGDVADEAKGIQSLSELLISEVMILNLKLNAIGLLVVVRASAIRQTLIPWSRLQDLIGEFMPVDQLRGSRHARR
jgi:hypothetical protein